MANPVINTRFVKKLWQKGLNFQNKLSIFAEMAFKVDPETLDTTDEVRIESLQKVPESSQNGKPRHKYQILTKNYGKKAYIFKKKLSIFFGNGL